MQTESIESANLNPVWGFAGTAIWGAVVYAVYIVVQVVVGIAYLVTNSSLIGTKTEQELEDILTYNSGVLLISGVAIILICTSLLFGIIKLKKGSNFKSYLGLEVVSIDVMKYWVTAILALFLINGLISLKFSITYSPEFIGSYIRQSDSLWGVALLVLITAPIFEEIFFRGFLLSGFARTFLGSWGAITLTSFLWAIVHTQYMWLELSQIFVIGIVLGIAKIQTGSVALTIVLHMLWNVLALITAIIYYQ